MDSCVFKSNSAGSGGGAIYFYNNDNSGVRSCTFYQNESPNGGALWTWLNCSTTVAACIFRENHAPTGSQIGINQGCFMTVMCCDVQYGQGAVYVGGGSTLGWAPTNFDLDPLFCPLPEGGFTIDSALPVRPGEQRRVRARSAPNPSDARSRGSMMRLPQSYNCIRTIPTPSTQRPRSRSSCRKDRRSPSRSTMSKAVWCEGSWMAFARQG